MSDIERPDNEYAQKPGKRGVLFANGGMNNIIPPKDLERSLRYNPETGNVHWKQSTGFGPPSKLYGLKLGGTKALRPGEVRRATIDGYNLNVCDIVWAMVTGEWPRFQLNFKDGNLDNTRFENLEYKVKKIYGGPGMRVRREEGYVPRHEANRILKLPVGFVSELFEYRPDGFLVWKINPSEIYPIPAKIPGEIVEMERMDSGLNTIQFYGGKLLAHMIVWAIHHGEYPNGVEFIDGDASNIRIENMASNS